MDMLASPMLLARDDLNVIGAKASAARGNPAHDVLAAIKTRLEERMASAIARIEVFHHTKKEFDLAEDDAAIAILYQGSTYSKDGMAGALSASRTMNVMVVYLHRLLDEQQSNIIQQRIEDIRLALHGSSFAGSKPLVPLDDGMDDYDGAVCLSHISFEAVIPAIATPQPRG